MSARSTRIDDGRQDQVVADAARHWCGSSSSMRLAGWPDAYRRTLLLIDSHLEHSKWPVYLPGVLTVQNPP